MLQTAFRHDTSTAPTYPSLHDEIDAGSTPRSMDHHYLKALLDGGGIGTWDWDLPADRLVCDHNFAAMIGEETLPAELDGWCHRTHPDDASAARARLDRHLSGDSPLYVSTHRLQRRDGSWMWVRIRGNVVSRDEGGRAIRMVGIAQDVTDQKTAEAALNSSAALLKRTGEMANVGGWEFDIATRQLTWTDQIYRIHELPVGSSIDLQTALSFHSTEGREKIETAMRLATDDFAAWDHEVALTTSTGRRIWIRSYGEPVIADVGVVKLCGAIQDVTLRKQAEEQLRNAATHDRLTGLPNRALLHDRLQQCIQRSARNRKTFAVLFLDFDRFKHVNDTLGHDAGDELLRQIAGRLRSSLRPADTIAVQDDLAMAGRLGGDEFVVILDEIVDAVAATTVARRLLDAFAHPYTIAGQLIDSTASIGIVTSGERHTTAEDMLRDADRAMYEAKKTGRGRYAVAAQPDGAGLGF